MLRMFEHLADDELAVLREERRNALYGVRHSRKRCRGSVRPKDIESEIGLLTREIEERSELMRRHLAAVHRAEVV
jgi:hypothetical protein